MVSRRASRGAPGFSLAEVLAALVVLGIGVLGAVATATHAARVLRQAGDREAAVRLAGTVLDSLLQVPDPAAGERVEARRRATWTVRQAGKVARIEVVVAYEGPAGERDVRVGAWHAPALRPIGGEP